MSNTQAEKYARRFAKVLDHIESNLGETLSTELLSQVANFSKFHFHRQFVKKATTVELLCHYTKQSAKNSEMI